MKSNMIIRTTKGVIKSNKVTKRLAQRTKRLLLGVPEPAEIYDYSAFYPSISDYKEQTDRFETYKNPPLISILLPTYNTPKTYLEECIDSILLQSYPKWELCIADDNSPDKEVVKLIKKYQAKDKRIKLIERKQNGHISAATNSALEIAKGDFVALMDHDDVLWPNALSEVADIIQKNKKVDFIYTDEDKIDGSGLIHSYPFLKPDFSPEFLESCNYITHFSCIRTTVMKKVGGFRKGYEGAQDWDLFVRIAEVTQNVIHIPKILYSWRIHEASTAADTDAKPYVYEAQKKLLEDHINRIGKKGYIEKGIIQQHRTIKYDIEKNSLLSIVIRSTEFEKTKRLLKSLLGHEAGATYEIIYSNSNTLNEEDRAKLTSLVEEKKQVYIDADSNIKQLSNKANGDTMLFIEDSIEIISHNWAKSFIADSSLDGAGVVCPVLLEKDTRTIFSAGVGIGYGDNAQGYADMLKGMPFDDPHYSRGLYAKSRRNVSMVNSAAFGFKKKLVVGAEIQKTNSIQELCLYFLEKGYRNIYNPYIRCIVHGENQNHSFVFAQPKTYTEDQYLNPNFNHNNQKMEIKIGPTS